MKDILYPIRCLHGAIYEKRKEKKQFENKILEIKTADPSTLFFVLSPTHGNLGDHAIAKAATDMLKELSIDFIEVTTNELKLLSEHRKLSIMNCHPIMVNGGGNLGTLWPAVENIFREVIKNNPDSSIMCLPNTIYYEDSDYGREQLEESKQIYNAHKKLLLCAREKASYAFMKDIYNNVMLIPDMVLAMNMCGKAQKRSGCILCLRRDIEKTRTDSDEQIVKQQVKCIFGDNVKYSDMNIERHVAIEERENVLNEKFSEFSESALVITDRLHGMIFAAVTGTPCIVLNSKSPKVKGCYEWIKGLGYIKFADDAADIEKIYRTIPKQDNYYNNTALNPFYDTLKAKMLEMNSKGK